MSGALKSLSQMLGRVGIRLPWKYTGVASGLEYQNHLPNADDYRAQSPASRPENLAVPQATPETVFDITYYKRDHRNPLPEKKAVESTDEAAPAGEPVEQEWRPPTPGVPFRWTKPKPLLDYENNGYT
ncbi:hypothetical protein BSKO_08816 [Bryopsis sp. KO-2023]|nr:hypothetical protein BSKO_08816 [Bryopsis sp. KO-2023]